MATEKSHETYLRNRDRVRAWWDAHPGYGHECYLRRKARYHADPKYRKRILKRKRDYYRRHRDKVAAYNRAYRERMKNAKNDSNGKKGS